MMTRKGTLKIGSVLMVCAFVTAACGGGDGSDGDGDGDGDSAPVALRAAHEQDPSHPYQICGFDRMSELLEEQPEANITLETFPGGQLGSNQDNLEELQASTLDMAAPGIGSLTIFDESVGAIETAFSAEDFDQVQEIVDGDFGTDIIEPLRDSANVRVVGPLWKLGSRHVTADRPVLSPDDLNGVAMRSQQQAASRATVEALGGTPTPIDFAELYLALSQGVVAAQENPIVQIDQGNFKEVQDYLMMTGHIVNVTTLAMAESSYQALSDEQQNVLEEVAEQVATEVNDCIDTAEEEIVAEWNSEDPPAFEIIAQEELDMEAFRENALEVYTGEGSEYAELWGDLYLELTEG